MWSQMNPCKCPQEIRVMGFMFFCNATAGITPFPKTVTSYNRFYFPSTNCPFPSPSSSPSTVNCKSNESENEGLSLSLAYDVLGVNKDCSYTGIKSAFRSKVKQFHPDVQKDVTCSDLMIRRVILAYEILSTNHQLGTNERECLDPFDEPECEALDLFVNETLCVGKGCPYSCVKRAPHAFSFGSSTGTAHATSQGHGDDYQVQLAVGQCPRNCIHYVTPSQRVILEELLDSILSSPGYDSSTEAEYLYSLITKAQFENNRYQKPKRQPKVSTQNVDWY